MTGIDFDFAKYVRFRHGLIEKRARDGAAYAYIGEHKVRRALISARPVSIAIEATTRLWRGSARKALLGESIKASDHKHRRVYDAGERAARALDMDAPAIYVARAGTDIDARALGTDDDACVVVNETLEQRLGDPELTAIIGHELAHIQNNHIPYTTALYYLQHDAIFFVRWIVQPAIMALAAWARRAEMTCDRGALLATRDLDATLAAIIKTSSRTEVDVAQYLAELPDSGRKGVTRYAELFRSHPLLPKRVQALRLFAQSIFYKQLIGQDVIDGLSSDAVDTRVSEILSVF